MLLLHSHNSENKIHRNREYDKMVTIMITILDYTGVHYTVHCPFNFLCFWNFCDKKEGKSAINGNLFREREQIFSPEEFEGVGRGDEHLEKLKQKDNYAAQGIQTDCESSQDHDQPHPKELPLRSERGSRCTKGKMKEMWGNLRHVQSEF